MITITPNTSFIRQCNSCVTNPAIHTMSVDTEFQNVITLHFCEECAHQLKYNLGLHLGNHDMLRGRTFSDNREGAALGGVQVRELAVGQSATIFDGRVVTRLPGDGERPGMISLRTPSGDVLKLNAGAFVLPL